MAASAGKLALEWLFESTFPLHAEFSERSHPLRQHELRWQCAQDYVAWAKVILLCLVTNTVPPHRRYEVRFHLQRAGRLAGACHEIQMRDVLRASWILERPVAPGSWFLGAIPSVGETDEYLHLVESSLPQARPAGGPDLPLNGEPPDLPARSLQGAAAQMAALVDDHLADDL